MTGLSSPLNPCGYDIPSDHPLSPEKWGTFHPADKQAVSYFPTDEFTFVLISHSHGYTIRDAANREPIAFSNTERGRAYAYTPCGILLAARWIESNFDPKYLPKAWRNSTIIWCDTSTEEATNSYESTYGHSRLDRKWRGDRHWDQLGLPPE